MPVKKYVKKLAGLALPNGLVWANQFDSQGISQKLDFTLEGTAVIFSQPFEKGHTISLVATIDTAWFEEERMKEIVALSKTPGIEMEFVWGYLDAQGLEVDVEPVLVQFDHRSGPAVSFRTILPEAPKFIGTIKLVTL